MLKDSVLESILWNKAPISLQQEIKEITVGSVQELLQKLLHAESAVYKQNQWLSREQDSISVLRRSRGGELERGDAIPGRSVPSSQADPSRGLIKQVG